jgi:hypothetical protein
LEEREWNSAPHMLVSKEDTNQGAQQPRHWKTGGIVMWEAEGTHLGADDGVMSHTAGKAVNSLHISQPTQYTASQIPGTQLHGHNNIKRNMWTRPQG